MFVGVVMALAAIDFRDASQPVPARVASLLSQMTLAEKVAQLAAFNGNAPAGAPSGSAMMQLAADAVGGAGDACTTRGGTCTDTGVNDASACAASARAASDIVGSLRNSVVPKQEGEAEEGAEFEQRELAASVGCRWPCFRRGRSAWPRVRSASRRQRRNCGGCARRWRR